MFRAVSILHFAKHKIAGVITDDSHDFVAGDGQTHHRITVAGNHTTVMHDFGKCSLFVATAGFKRKSVR